MVVDIRCSGNRFGPLATECNDNFDFTLEFEAIILSLLPSLALSLVTVLRLHQLYRKPRLVVQGPTEYIKLVSYMGFWALQVAILGLWCGNREGIQTTPCIVAASVLAFCACLLIPLSMLEHSRTVQPSSILPVYLLSTALLDCVRSRTLWRTVPHSALAAVFVASTALKGVLLALEGAGKTAHLLGGGVARGSPEESCSFFSRATFFWIQPLLWRGARQSLTLESLFELREEIRTDTLGRNFLVAQHELKRKSSACPSIWALWKVLKWPILKTVLPRILLLVFTLCQPLLVNSLLSFLGDATVVGRAERAVALVAAFSVVYIGTAISSALYWYHQTRVLTMVRGCLVSAVSWKISRLELGETADQDAGITLMSTDTQRISLGLQNMHDIWANIIQVAVATFILERELGLGCIAPIIITVLCFMGSVWAGRHSNRRQRHWMEAVEQRLGLLKLSLGSVKGLMMRGLWGKTMSAVQDRREVEVSHLKRYRMLMVLTAGLAFIPKFMAPVLAYLVYILQTRESLDATRVFTSLSTLAVLTQPLSLILQTLPITISAISCFDRIDQFLQRDEHRDWRDAEPSCCPPNAPLPCPLHVESSSDLQLASAERTVRLVEKTVPLAEHNLEPTILEIVSGSFGYNRTREILHGIDLSIPRGRLTMIVGPVSSGKSTLCKTLLGETVCIRGRLTMFTHRTDVAFCGQPVCLMNSSVKRNIIMFSPFDETWYSAVVRACALVTDIAAMTDADETLVGSNGAALSGGQKQRIGLARALYARKRLLVLDDVLAALDPSSARHVFTEVLGPLGLARRHDLSVVFATHSVQFLAAADHVIALAVNGRLEYQGRYEEGALQQFTVSGSTVDALSAKPSTDDAVHETATTEKLAVHTRAITVPNSKDRPSKPSSLYTYYCRAAGPRLAVVLVAVGLADGFLYVFPTYWLQLWTSVAASHNLQYWGVYCSLQIGALACLSLFIYLSLTRAGATASINLHLKLVQALEKASWKLFTTVDSGAILNRFSQDIQLVDGEFPIGFSDLVLDIAFGVGQCALIIASSPWTGIAFVGLLVVVFALQRFYLRTSQQLRVLDLEAKTPLYTHYIETVKNLQTIRASGWEGEVVNVGHRLLCDSQRPLYLLAMVQQWLNFVLNMIVALLAIITVAIAVSQRLGQGLTGVALTQIMSMGLVLQGLILAWTRVETAATAIDRIRDFTEHTSFQRVATKQAPQWWPSHGQVEFLDVSANYGSPSDAPAIKNLTLRIKSGEKLLVCGTSGSGKSSLLMSILGLLHVQSGSIQIDKVDLDTLDPQTIRERINTIPQDPVFLQGSLRFNLDPTNRYTDEDLAAALRSTGLEHVLGGTQSLTKDFHTIKLSQGERQLFALASAVLHRPKIILIDELGSQVDQAIRDRMEDLVRVTFSDATVITVAHHVQSCMHYDRIVVLENGRLVECDTPKLLLQRQSHFKTIFEEGNRRL